MANIENLKEKANEAAQGAAKVAKYVAFVSKKRLAIISEQEKIRRAYTKLGKVYYKDYVTDEEPDEAEYKPLCEAITASFSRINDMKEEIAAAKAEYCGEDAAQEDPEEDDIGDEIIEELPENISEEAAEENAE